MRHVAVVVFGFGEPRRRLGGRREAFGEGEAAEREVFLPKYVGHGAKRDRERDKKIMIRRCLIFCLLEREMKGKEKGM